MAGQALVLTSEDKQSGYGSGDGYGYGYGDGSGSGYGSGYGDLSAALDAYRHHELVRAAVEDGQTVHLAWWRSGRDGQSANGGTPTLAPAAPGVLHEVTGPLQLCTGRALHASLNPAEWKGDRWWVVALFDPVARQGSKAGSLKRLIVAEL